MIKVEVLLLIRLLTMVFIGILFVQSAMDKILNYNDNQQWINSYFNKSIFKGQTKILFFTITLLESGAGLLCIIGIFYSKNIANPLGFYGLFLSSIALLCLFMGQRIAKDYAAAANMPGYLVVSLIGLFTYLM